MDSDDFSARFDELATSVIEHAEAEEENEWPALREITDPNLIAAMITTMSAVPTLGQDDSAPDPDATFDQMQAWARSRLP